MNWKFATRMPTLLFVSRREKLFLEGVWFLLRGGSRRAAKAPVLSLLPHQAEAARPAGAWCTAGNRHLLNWLPQPQHHPWDPRKFCLSLEWLWGMFGGVRCVEGMSLSIRTIQIAFSCNCGFLLVDPLLFGLINTVYLHTTLPTVYHIATTVRKSRVVLSPCGDA